MAEAVVDLARIENALAEALPDVRALPHGAIGYPRLARAPLSPDRVTGSSAGGLADDVASLLVALHGIPVQEARRLEVPEEPQNRAALAALRDAVLALLCENVRPRATTASRRRLRRGRHLALRRAARRRPGLRHRIARRWELLEFAGVRSAVELRDAAELDETLEKLRAGPILRGY